MSAKRKIHYIDEFIYIHLYFVYNLFKKCNIIMYIVNRCTMYIDDWISIAVFLCIKII